MKVNKSVTKNNLISKKKAYSVICLFLSLSVFLSACSFFGKSVSDLVGEIKTTEPDSSEQADTSFRIPYSLADTLSIYDAECRVNSDLISLCYPGLIKVNSSWDAECVLAESFERQGNKVTFTISDKAVFSDGTNVTASDCEYSFGMAEAGERYSDFFNSVISYGAEENGTFSVTFAYSGTQYTNLCFIPIVKIGTGSETGVAVGAGKYKAEKSEDKIILTSNPYCEEMSDAKITRIEAVGYSSQGDMMSDFNYGQTDAIYADLSDGATKYRASNELSAFTSNAMIAVVVNPYRSYFSSYVNVCKGLSVGLDRERLYKEALSGCAVMTWTPFNPSWSKTKDADLSEDNYDKEASEQYFYDARLYKDENWQYEYYGQKISLSVVVDSGNRNHTALAQALSEQLSEMGFSVTVKSLSGTSYSNAVQNKNYDILIKEINVGYDMDLRKVLNEIGYSSETTLSSALEDFSDGNKDIKTVLEYFSAEMPFIPLCYVRSALALNLSVKGRVEPSENCIFTGIEEWYK